MADLGSASYSEVDASNNATPPDGWPSGMFPNQVEGAARAGMGALKRFWDRVNSVFSSDGTGTSTAYTLTYPQAAAAYYNGEEFSWTVDKTCGASPTLAINGLTAYPLRKFVSGAWANLVAGDIAALQVVRVRYNSSVPSFDVVSFLPSNYVLASTTGLAPTGATMGFRGSTSQVPVGWVLERGNSIGDASSGATERANADTSALFTLLWANTNYGLQNSSGSTVSRGANAAADYAAHCRLVLPNMTSKFRRGDTTAATAGGADTHTHSVLGNTLTPTDTAPQSIQSGISTQVSSTIHTHAFTGNADSQPNIPAYVTELSIIKL